MDTEYGSLIDHDTWTLVKLPPGKVVIDDAGYTSESLKRTGLLSVTTGCPRLYSRVRCQLRRNFCASGLCRIHTHHHYYCRLSQHASPSNGCYHCFSERFSERRNLHAATSGI
ncbi:hypothetical protein LIPSTDRAFT_338132 [Lipomyces starkeyi NRRL Y-11557]|uniref:Uncharacterized protein n=1 Tax=Lipomyces starkeyi NRRL Y-11557 TaxID=675824 RepID=A0A1E3Q2E7_LIPST|nr:hypothetical protein LIPSTDRAFT_338132 [Lipomyces starkeyi NRRL Y-11557]